MVKFSGNGSRGATLIEEGYMIIRRTLLLAILVALPISIAVAQQTTTQETVPGQAATETNIRSGEVVTVDGNDLFVRMDDGQVKHFNVPPDAKFMIDGKEVSISELQPGTKLSQTIETTTTPQTVKTVTSIKGKVWQVTPPTMVILSMPDGTNKQYHIPKDQKFNVNGQQVDAFALKPGMKIDATVVRETPEEVVTHEKGTVAGQAPTPPPAPAPAEPVQTAQAQPAPAPPAAPAENKETLPQTASPLPLLGLLGLMSVSASLGLKRLRK
jgi:RNase P/RNase MRP subunit p29